MKPVALQAFASTTTALAELHDGLRWLGTLKEDDAHYDIVTDAVIKRFKTLFEYVWKLLKWAAEYQGVEAPGPRPAIQEAVRFGWIDDPEFWVDVLDARNGSVHDYFGIEVSAYLSLIHRFADDVTRVVTALKTQFKVT